jgi:nucleoside-diphosphate-sugar epimerase
MKSDGTPWRPIVHIEDISKAVIAVLASPQETIHNEAFNVGINSENYQIKELADFVRATIPNCEISFADDAGPDLRNYRVTFDKYSQTFPDFELQWDAMRGAKSIYESYQWFGLDKDEYEGPKYKRIAQLKQLIANGDLDQTMRWTK